MNSLTYTVIAIEQQEGYSTIWASVGSSDPAIYASGTIGLQVSDAIAAMNTVGAPLVLPS